MTDKNQRLIDKCREIIQCDTARISYTENRLFLIIGFNRSTKNDPGQWVKNGEPYDFNYVEEHVVASGGTPKELLESCQAYVSQALIKELKNG